MLSHDLVCDLASGLAATSLWTPHVQHGLHRSPVRLVASDSWEAWIIGWTVGHQVEMHDHGLSSGAIAVIDGELTELELDGAEVLRRRLPAGTTRWLRPGTIHDILATGRAISLHVYSRPLTSMTFYDGRGRPRWTNLIEPEEPVVDLRSAARALHPAVSRG
jgi:hypothetical protein